MRDHGDDLFGTGVQPLERVLAAFEDCGAGEAVGVRGWRRLVWVDGVDGRPVELREFFGEGGNGGAGIARFGGVF